MKKSRLLTLLAMTVTAFSFQANAYYYFGYQGQSGFPGINGTDGATGRQAIITANGSYQYHDLKGTDGTSGGNGYDGQSAYSCFQPFNAPYNLEGARGGEGGNAGRGGNGGTGGDATVFFQDEAQLKNIAINNIGGRAGFAGREGQGGYGCRCQMYSWSNVVCWNQCDPQGHNCRRVCENRFFYCYDGRDGIDGYRARDGVPGKPGSLKLVKGLNSLPQANDNVAGLLEKILAQKSFELSKPSWSQRSGAEQLFAQGSQLDTNYLNFDGYKSAAITVEWSAMMPSKSYGQEVVQLSLSDAIEPYFSFVNKGLWDVTEKSFAGGVWNFNVKNVVTESDVLTIAPESVIGTEKSTTLILRDPKFVSLSVGTSVELTVKGRGFWGSKTLFKGIVNQQLVESKIDEVKVYVGLLDLDPSKLKAGDKIALEIKLTRSLGTKVAVKTSEFSTVLQ